MKKLVVSLFLLMLGLAWANPQAEQIQKAKNGEEAAKIARSLPPPKSEAARDALNIFLESPSDDEARRALVDQMRIDEALAQKPAAGPIKVDAAAAKRARGVVDLAESQQSNWLQKGLTSFGEWLGSLFRPRESPNIQAPNLPQFSLPNFVTPLMWGVLTVVVAGAIFLLIRYLAKNWGHAHRVRRGGLLDDDEPLLSSDEWLARGDKLIQEGDYRLAARCFYLAILMRLDQHRRLTFVRTDTNWEHFRRYQPAAPLESFDLREPTQHFDIVWYDEKPVSHAEALWFRERYSLLLSALGGRAA